MSIGALRLRSMSIMSRFCCHTRIVLTDIGEYVGVGGGAWHSVHVPGPTVCSACGGPGGGVSASKGTPPRSTSDEEDCVY